MADIQMNGRGFAPQAGSYQTYQAYAPAPQAADPSAAYAAEHAAPQPQKRGGMSVWAALLGSALSIGLVIGVSIWGYQLMARDVSGVPVVRAVQGEMRVRPEEPGGSQAAHQGLSVNEVAAAGATAGPSDQIVLAPEPINLDDTNMPLIDQLVAAQPGIAAASNDGGATQTAPAAQALSPEMASIKELADKIAAGATPLAGIGETTGPDVETALGLAPSGQSTGAPTAAELGQTGASQSGTSQTAALTATVPATAISPTTPGVSLSLRPQLRPSVVRSASADSQTIFSDTSASGPRDIDAATLPTGTRLVQLGAYESPEIARREWDRFNDRFPDYMAGKDRVIQRALSGGRTFFRLRVHGFGDLADARRFCSALTAQNTDCIPVVTR